MDYKELIERLKYYGTTYAIGDNLGREINGSDDLMLTAATAIETLLAERDVAVEEMHGRCIKCNHFSVGFLDYPCTDCRYEGGANDHWKWRGPQKENKED